MRTLLALSAALLLFTGCTTIHTQIPNFPTLRVTEHQVPFSEMMAKCYPGMPLWMKLLGSFPLACAEFNFLNKTCDIYITPVSPDWVVEHEREHCTGGDHFGEVQGMLDRYRQNYPNL